MGEFTFELKEYKEEEVPSGEVAAQTALEFTSKIQTEWTKGKDYPKDGCTVKTYNTRLGGDFWMARVSRHGDVGFDAFKKGIFENHTENEVEYIPLLDSFKILGETGDWRSVLVHYKFPRLFSDREMTVWIAAVQPDPEVKQFVVISLPSDRPIVEDVTRAYYCSIEVVTYLEDEGCVEWLMAQASDACGNIPRWIQDRSVTASVVDDVPHFISWAKQKYQN
ncbi:hypothetical protein TRICI_002803 [Trichomonascus ciferrii]|uniref:DUF3074 domain-containing protein n=1 Tax=Trichomonascus ciferrii TaxID=44093 RepID=A0A642V4X4_9ASCO|nr:hypothetical protein TRICI_002803 [Trichomonascus ciferrii]